MAKRGSASKIFFALAAFGALSQALSLVARVRDSQTDFSVFYRGAVALSQGAGGEFYRAIDAPTGWYNCTPPTGMGVLYGLTPLTPTAAAGVWAAFNLCLLGVGIWLLAGIVKRLEQDGQAYESSFLWASGTLLALGSSCIQVGQFSVLFVACWLLYVWAVAMDRKWLAALSIALPASVKVYPAILAGVPEFLRRHHEVARIALCLVGLVIVVPFFLYGPRSWELAVGFVDYSLLAPGGRVADSADPTAFSNQSIDAVMLRYLTYQEPFHSRAPWLAHLNLGASQVLFVANLVRLAILAVTAFVTSRAARRLTDSPVLVTLLVMAAWCAALYLILPGAKGRYAVYAFPAFLPLLASAATRPHSKWLCLAAGLSLFLLMQLGPDWLNALSISIAAPIFLWTFNLRVLARRVPAFPPSPILRPFARDESELDSQVRCRGN
ncbi:MAG: DUF2029 domain-containing protein [Armatimonadetes bacterium]|nr:DUF2029 domain-containing protein [Armatimonadota bacterium]